jgi:hypothetical protein
MDIFSDSAEEISNEYLELRQLKIYDSYIVVRLTLDASSELHNNRGPVGVQNRELPLPTKLGTYSNWTAHQM